MKKNAMYSNLESVEQLFRQYYKVLRVYAFRFVNDWDVAEDIVQDVFVALWNKRTDIEFDGAVKAYLFKAVYNKSLNFLTSKKYTEEESMECFSDQIDALQIQEDNQENSLFMRELRGEIEAFVETLPVQVKKVFILSRSYGLKVKEIAVQLDLSPKTVEKYLTRALLELRTHLKNKGLMSLLFLLCLCSK